MKMKMFIPAGMALAALAAGCQYQQNCRNEALEEKVLVLEQELAELKDDQTDMILLREIFGDMQRRHGQLPSQLVTRYLELIAPPENPTAEQVNKYLADIANLSNVNMDTRGRGMIKAQLTSFGRDYLQDMLSYANTSYIKEAVSTLIKPEDKEMLRNLAMNSSRNSSYAVADLFLNLAGESDKKDVLLLLRNHPQGINAVIRLGLEKEALPIIKQKLVADGRFSNYEKWLETAINNMNEDDLQDLIRKIWRAAKVNSQNDRWGTWDTARKLAPLGCIGAFHFMVESKDVYRNDQSRQRQILELCDVEDLKSLDEWYKKNKNNLVFDSKRNIYTAAEAE